MRISTSWPWYPLLIVAAVIIGFWSGVDVRLAAVVRPLLLTIGVIGCALLVSVYALGKDRGGLVTGAIVLVALSSTVQRAFLFLIVATLAVLLTVAVARVRRLPFLSSVTTAGNVFAAALLLVVLATSLAAGAVARAAGEVGRFTMATGEPAEEATGSPNIYLLMLDGYPRADTLARLADFDNRPFLRSLEAAGLEVSERSRSSYMHTAYTLQSMFDLEHMRTHATRSALNESAGLRHLKEEGYRVVTVATAWEDVRIDNVDEVCGDGQVSELEILLIQSSILQPLIAWLDPDFEPRVRRGYVNSAFECLVEHIGEDPPQFVFIHVPSPHWPIVFRRDGSPAARDAFLNATDATAIEDAYIEQIEYVNIRALAAVERIVAADPSAVLVVFSDHGSEFGLVEDSLEETDVEERTANLFAARTPGHSCLFGDGPTTVNILARLLETYLDVPVDRESNDLFLSSSNRPSKIVRQQNPDASDDCAAA